MATDVVMPQMGESIAEGTIVRWIKKVGDTVDRDEPLFEISTDKVDAEIPSPAAGVVTEIRAKEGETVAGQQRRRRDRRAAAAKAAPSRRRRRQPARRAAEADAAAADADRRRRSRSSAGRRTSAREAAAAADAATAAPQRDAREPVAPQAPERSRARPPRTRSASARRRWCARLRRNTTSTSRRSTAPASPGRVTKNDILAFIGRKVGQAGRKRPAGAGRTAGGPATVGGAGSKAPRRLRPAPVAPARRAGRIRSSRCR